MGLIHDKYTINDDAPAGFSFDTQPVEAEMALRKGNAMKREFVINNRERMIFCKLNMPEGNQMVPTVILCHGYNGSCEGFTYHQEFLGKRKMASIAFDFCGGSVHSKSSLDTTMMTIETEIEDLIAVYNYVSNMERVDTHHIIFHGESRGGFVSAIAAARLGDKISGLNLVYPALCIPDNWNEKFKNISDIPEVEELWGMKLGKSFFMSLRNIEVYSEICQYTGSVHIVHGDQDEIVPLHYSENAVKKYKNARLAVLSGEGHGFSSEGVEKTLNFFYNSESI